MNTPRKQILLDKNSEWRRSILKETTFVCGCDNNETHYNLMCEMLLSLKLLNFYSAVDMNIVDCGMNQEQKRYLNNNFHIKNISKPNPDFNNKLDSLNIRKTDMHTEMLTRPFVGDFFPGYRYYFHLDTDLWIQDESGLDDYLLLAQKQGIAVSCVDKDINVRYSWNNLDIVHDSLLNDKLNNAPFIGAGVYVIDIESKFMELYKQYLIMNLDQKGPHHLSEQAALNCVWAHNQPLNYLPCQHNQYSIGYHDISKFQKKQLLLFYDNVLVKIFHMIGDKDYYNNEFEIFDMSSEKYESISLKFLFKENKSKEVKESNNLTDFNWEFYLDYYEDLRKAGLKNAEDARNHWINFGSKEGRSYIPLDFDWKIYLDNNADLITAGLATEREAKSHYLIFGKKEGRLYKKKEKITVPDNIKKHEKKILREFLSMIGEQRMDNIYYCVHNIILDKIEGDFVETGVWKGGACLFMKKILQEYKDNNTKIFVCDSFEGLPKIENVHDLKYEKLDNEIRGIWNNLEISEHEVLKNFENYNALDKNVIIVKGWFSETLPKLETEKISLLRLDGDLYTSTLESLNSLYGKLSVGGYCIIDDYYFWPACKEAVDEFRNINNITEEIINIDWCGIYWRKEKDNEIIKVEVNRDIREDIIRSLDSLGFRLSYENIPVEYQLYKFGDGSKIYAHKNGDGKLKNDLIEFFNKKNKDETKLCKIMKRNGSQRDVHNYTQLYDFLFNEYTNVFTNIFELGISTARYDMVYTNISAPSLISWTEYFPNSFIYAADKDKNVLIQDDNIKSFYVDQRDKLSVINLADNLLKDVNGFDLIIDDGDHTFESNVNFLENFYHKLNKNGYYIIEDVYKNEENINNFLKVMEKYQGFVLILNYPNSDFNFFNALCIIKKNEK
jgi:O-methyltransferase